MIRFIAVSTLASVAFSCTPAASTEKKDLANVEEVKQALNAYYADIKENGLTAEFKYLDSSADFFWVPPGYSSAMSYDSIAAAIRRNAKGFTRVDNSFETLRVIPLSEEHAVYTAKLRSLMTDTSGKETQVFLLETGVMIKRSDGWKLLSGQTAVLDNDK